MQEKYFLALWKDLVGSLIDLRNGIRTCKKSLWEALCALYEVTCASLFEIQYLLLVEYIFRDYFDLKGAYDRE